MRDPAARGGDGRDSSCKTTGAREELEAIDAAIAAGRLQRITLAEAMEYDEAQRAAYARAIAVRVGGGGRGSCRRFAHKESPARIKTLSSWAGPSGSLYNSDGYAVVFMTGGAEDILHNQIPITSL